MEHPDNSQPPESTRDSLLIRLDRALGGTAGITSAAGYLASRALLVAVVVVLSLMIYRQFFEVRIVAVDLRGVVAKEIENFQKRGATEAEQQEAGDRFTMALDTALNELSHDGRTIVLTKPAVIRGVEDATTDFQARVRELMEKKQ
jgi:hypothetical protein